MATMRTIKQAIEEIKAEDSKTSFTERALRTLINKGDIPSVKVGNKNLVNMDILEKYLSSELANSDFEIVTSSNIKPIY